MSHADGHNSNDMTPRCAADASFASTRPSYDALCAFMTCRAGKLPRACPVAVAASVVADGNNNNNNNNNNDNSSHDKENDDDNDNSGSSCIVCGVAPYEYTGCDYTLALYSCVAPRCGGDSRHRRSCEGNAHAATRARVTALLSSLCWSTTPLRRQLHDNVRMFCRCARAMAPPRVVRDALRPSRLRGDARCTLAHLQVQHWLYWLDTQYNNNDVDDDDTTDAVCRMRWSPYDTMCRRVRHRRRFAGVSLRRRQRNATNSPRTSTAAAIAHDDDSVDDDDDDDVCAAVRACRSLSRAALQQQCGSVTCASSTYTPLGGVACAAAASAVDEGSGSRHNNNNNNNDGHGAASYSKASLQYDRPWRAAMKASTTTTTKVKATGARRVVATTSAATTAATAAAAATAVAATTPSSSSLYAQWVASRRAVAQLRRVLADVRACAHRHVLTGGSSNSNSSIGCDDSSDDASAMEHMASRLREAAAIAATLARDVPP